MKHPNWRNARMTEARFAKKEIDVVATVAKEALMPRL